MELWTTARHGAILVGGRLGARSRSAVAALNPWRAAGAPVSSATLLSTVQFPATAPYQAFTDLLFAPDLGPRGTLLTVHREGQTHTSRDGKIRVMGSTGGANWSSLALLSSPWDTYPDLRDPKITRRPDGQFMVNCGGLDAGNHIQSACFLSADARTFDGGHQVGPLDRWLWRPVWGPADTCYAVGYDTTPTDTDAQLAMENLYSSTDGLAWGLVAANFVPRQGGEVSNEAGLAFTAAGTAVCIPRSEVGATWCHLLTASAPYTTWTNRITDVTTGNFLPPVKSPVLLVLPDGRILLAGRFLINNRVALALVNTAGHVTLLLNLTPNTAGVDCGYPGLAWVNGLLYVSYYSDHLAPGTPSIFVATVQLPPA